MKITFLGSGSAWVSRKENYQSNILIEDSLTGANLLFDAGRTLPEALEDADLTFQDIDSVFISHNHGDHTGGMEDMGFRRYFGTFPFGEDKPKLFGHTRTLEELWEDNLKAGMRSLQDRTANLETYFDTTYLGDSSSFKIGSKIDADIVQTIHVIDDRRFMPSHGLMLTENNKKVFITGDSQLAPNQMRTFYEHADVIFHDCELAEYPNSVHAQYHELAKLPEAIKAKMWLYHYDTKGGTVEMPDAVADGFKGFVYRGSKFEY